MGDTEQTVSYRTITINALAHERVVRTVSHDLNAGQVVVDPTTGRGYALLKRLNEGSFGKTWTAGKVPTIKYVIKEIDQGQTEAYDDFKLRVEREYQISQILFFKSRSYCEKYASCAHRFFIAADEEKPNLHSGYLVFDYVNAIELQLYYLLKAKYFLMATDEAFIDRWQQDMLKTTIWLFKAIGKLHSFNVIHRDIKPENVIVQINAQQDGIAKLNLIDFGFSCYVGNKDALSAIADFDVEDVLCNGEAMDYYDYTRAVYSASSFYRDPATGSGPAKTIDPTKTWDITDKKVPQLFKSFDGYSLALTAQLAYDPIQNISDERTMIPSGNPQHVYKQFQVRPSRMFPTLVGNTSGRNVVQTELEKMVQAQLETRPPVNDVVQVLEQLRIEGRQSGLTCDYKPWLEPPLYDITDDMLMP